jgi:cellulose synthase (UDP-forming)
MAYTLSYMIVNLMMQNYLYGAFRWPWISELYEYVQTVHLLPAVISVMLNPRKPTFKVTAKDESIEHSRLSEIGIPFFVIFAVLVAGVAMTAFRVYNEPFKTDVTLVVGGWNLLNLVLAGCALGVVSERGDPQRSRRVSVRRRCEFRIGDQWYPGTVEDVSVEGARVQVFGGSTDDLAIDKEAAIRVTPHSDLPGDILPVRIRNFRPDANGVTVGCQYEPTETVHHRIVADLIFANSDQWTAFQLSRRGNPGLLRGTLWFLWLAVYQTGRGLVYFGRVLRPSRRKAALRAAQ